jgi:hypothetical protein
MVDGDIQALLRFICSYWHNKQHFTLMVETYIHPEYQQILTTLHHITPHPIRQQSSVTAVITSHHANQIRTLKQSFN